MTADDRDRPSNELPTNEMLDASNPTREIPVQSARVGAAWASPSHPSAPGYPVGSFASAPPTQEKPRRTVGLASAAIAGASLLVIGLGGGFLLGGSGADHVVTQNLVSSSSAGQSKIPGSAQPAPTPYTAPAPSETAPSDTSTASTAAVGTVSSISGASFVVQGLDGVICHVTTTNSTRVATLRGSGGVRNLSVGDPVFVKGEGGADGVLTADLVIAGAFPDLGAGTP